MDTITTIQSLLRCSGSAQPVTVALTQNDERLIAAAPDMLKALKNMVAYCEPYAEDFAPDEAVSIAFEEARAAIAKAEGKS